MPKEKNNTIGFPFFQYLELFLNDEHSRIYKEFKPLTKKFLNFNNRKQNTSAFLRVPQFEALEMYVFLKEYCNNKKMWQVFDEWYNKKEGFENRRIAGIDEQGQMELFGVDESNDDTMKENFHKVFEQIKKMEQEYPNYIFALTMGLGKTVLMATSIFYEFLLANKYPNDERYCHNALVFAPDKTVLGSLREIITLDKSLVVPPEYVDFLESNLKFHFLDESGGTLNTLDGSNFNIIISNTQKIILKRKHTPKSDSELLFGAEMGHYRAITKQKWSDIQAEAGIEDAENKAELIANNRFAKLLRLKNLGIYVDEAHHVFGTKLQDDLITTSRATSLRVTINELAENLKIAGSKVVACYNYTGTPYVNNRLLPEVVYYYGLSQAIDNGYLKKIDPMGLENITDDVLAFCRIAIKGFWEKCGEKRVENMLPKMAIFASRIDQLETELRPAVEKVLGELHIPTSKILVNVGDDSITRNDDIREFNNLDSSSSEKQFILLVNKGREGWNCRSLFSVAMYREPTSKVFVLQAAMRCLRQIGDYQHTAYLYFSNENMQILDEELKSNFNVTLDDMRKAGIEGNVVKVKPVPPAITISITHAKKLYNKKEKKLAEHVDFKSNEYDFESYKIIGTRRKMDDLSVKIGHEIDYTSARDKREYSPLTIVAEIARYLNVSPLKINDILKNSVEGMEKICKIVNDYNEVLYDEIIPRLFKEMYEIEEFECKEEQHLKLVIEPDSGYYNFKCKPELVVSMHEAYYEYFKKKSFNLDNYCFDSKPEKDLFIRLLKNEKDIENVWFTGMLANGQTEFKVYYIDPESHGVRAYYPDFLVKKKDGSYVIVEVKGENKMDDKVVLAKRQYAEQIAMVSGMKYEFVPSQKVDVYPI